MAETNRPPDTERKCGPPEGISITIPTWRGDLHIEAIYADPGRSDEKLRRMICEMLRANGVRLDITETTLNLIESPHAEHVRIRGIEYNHIRKQLEGHIETMLRKRWHLTP